MALGDIWLETSDESGGFLSSFKAAIRERCAVATYAGTKTVPFERFAASGFPILWEDVDTVTELVRKLGNVFIDTTCTYGGGGDDINTCAVGSWCNFPKTLAYRMRTDAEHDINADRIARLDTWDDDSLSTYREVLSNCAYWLNEMTTVAVPTGCARHYAQAKGRVVWDTFSGSDAPTDEGPFETSCVSTFSNAKKGYPTIAMERWDQQYNYGPLPVSAHHTETFGYKSVTATYGCSILNSTPYDAECNLYFLHTADAETNRNNYYKQCKQYTYLQFDRTECSGFFHTDPEYPDFDDIWPSEFFLIDGYYGLVNGQLFKFQERATTAHTYTRDESSSNYGSSKDASGTDIGLQCSINGFQTATAYSTSSDRGIRYWYASPDNGCSRHFYTVIPLNDVEVGEPSFTQSIPAHTETMVWNAPTEVWEPPDWYKDFDLLDPGFNRGEWWWNDYKGSSINMRCLATLDFSGSFTMVET